jgi:hypothetical protein
MAENQQAVRPLRLNLPKRAVRRLEEVGIYCRSDVRLEYQQLGKRYVIHGTESGGAIREMGRYVTFCGAEGEPLEQLHPVDSLGVNGVHAVVVAPVLVKVDMFRFGRTYQLLISKHQPSQVSNGKRPSLESTELFRGADGFLALESTGRDNEKSEIALPAFYSRSGERIEIPERFHAVIQAAVVALSCTHCTHSHFLLPSPAFAAHH